MSNHPSEVRCKTCLHFHTTTGRCIECGKQTEYGKGTFKHRTIVEGNRVTIYYLGNMCGSMTCSLANKSRPLPEGIQPARITDLAGLDRIMQTW